MTESTDSPDAGFQAACDRLFVVSGCSGSGKSTLIEGLAERGEAIVREPGRQIVADEMRHGGDAVPWLNPQAFIDRCADMAIREFDRQLPLARRVFFDRSFIDVASAIQQTGLRAPASLEVALRTRRYAPIVFMSAPWEALFESDAERRHTFEDAVAEYEMLVPTYRSHGYELVSLPHRSVSDRVRFVFSTLSARRGETSSSTLGEWS